IHNSGTIDLNSPSYGTQLIAGSGGAVLDGSGTVAMEDQGGNAIVGSVLSNVDNLIKGAGTIGGSLQLVNLSGGTIDATAVNTQLVLNATSHAIVNEGLIEATGQAGLRIVHTSVDDSDGGILSAADGSHLDR